MATKRTGSIGEYDGLVKNDIEAARLKVVDENFEDERCLSSSTKHFDHGEDQPRDVNVSTVHHQRSCLFVVYVDEQILMRVSTTTNA